MKKFSLILLILSLFAISCSEKEEVPLELFSPEAFAFQLDEGWEVNASIQVKGFNQVEENDKYKTVLSYTIDLELPSGEVVSKVDFDNLTESSDEEILDYSIDSQIELDTNFTTGSYKLIFNVEDQFSQKAAKMSVQFDLAD